MPMPRWWARLNKRTFNRRELRRGKRPVLRHVGRKSGTIYRTPLDAHRIEDGFVFIVVYSPASDWVQNILAAEGGVLELDGEEHELVEPRMVGEKQAWNVLPEGTKKPPGFLRGVDYLRVGVRG